MSRWDRWVLQSCHVAVWSEKGVRTLQGTIIFCPRRRPALPGHNPVFHPRLSARLIDVVCPLTPLTCQVLKKDTRVTAFPCWETPKPRKRGTGFSGGIPKKWYPLVLQERREGGRRAGKGRREGEKGEGEQAKAGRQEGRREGRKSLMDSLNLVALTGILERDPIIRHDERSMPRCSAILRGEEVASTGTTYKTYVPLDAWGKTAEALGVCWKTSGGTRQAVLAETATK